MNSRTRMPLAALFSLALAVLPVAAASAGTVYTFGVSDQRTNITFESETDFEQILGSSNDLAGSAAVDWDKGTSEVSLEVPVASMRTGIDLRDEHMRSPGWLDAEQFPAISFKSKKAVQKNGTWHVEGTFTMHGVSRDLTVDVDVRRIPAETAVAAGLEKGEWVRISTSFDVKLSDFGVKIPEMAAAKVNDTWKVRIQAFAVNAK